MTSAWRKLITFVKPRHKSITLTVRFHMVLNSPYAPVPVSKMPLHQKIFDALEQHADNKPDGVAFVSAEDSSVKISFREIHRQAHAVASFLNDRGFGHLDVSCLVLSNCIPYTVFYLGALKCGGAISGASAMFTDFELNRQFKDSRCTVVITDESHLPKVLQATKNCPLIKTLICVRETSKPLPEGVFDYDDIVKTTVKDVGKVNFHHDDMALLPYSSGTTGSPKGVVLSHKNFGTLLDVFNDHFEKHAIPKMSESPWNWYSETSLLMLPFYHMYGFGLLNSSLLTGSTGVIFKKYDPTIFLQSIQRYRVKVLMLVPPIVLFMTKHPMVANYDVSSVRCVLTTAAPCGKDVCEEFLSRFPHISLMGQAYGMTECSMTTHLPLFDKKDNYINVGVIQANLQLKIVDVNTGQEVKRGESGEICVRGPTIMNGYLNRPEATAETIDKDGWLHSGDIGYLDERNQTHIVDRMKEIMKVKGLQVPPAELEDVLLSHPSIHDAAVIGIPDEKSGELPKAYIVRSHSSLSETEVQKYVEARVSPYKYLAGGVEFVQEIPKSQAGKILRRFLREKHEKDRKSKL